jgi:uncharacterized membrane protein
MIEKLFLLILLTFVPIFELRWSIPIGLFSGTVNVPFLGPIEGFGLDPLIVFVVCVFANAVLSILIYFFLHYVIQFFLLVPQIKSLYDRVVVSTQKKVKPLVEKHGLLGLAIFIAVPLPGSGTWTGTLAGYLLGFDLKKIFVANLIGVIIAGLIVTAFSLGFFSFLGV